MSVRNFSILALLGIVCLVCGCSNSKSEKQVREKFRSSVTKTQKISQRIAREANNYTSFSNETNAYKLSQNNKVTILPKDRLAQQEFDETPATAGTVEKSSDASRVAILGAKALAEYKKLSLINHIKNPRKALKTAFDQPLKIYDRIISLFPQ